MPREDRQAIEKESDKSQTCVLPERFDREALGEDKKAKLQMKTQ